MKVGLIGLGKMGLNLALNAKDDGWQIVGFDINEAARHKAEEQGITTGASIAAMLAQLDERKVVMISAPAGKITNDLVTELGGILAKDDIVIDAGNSNFHDSLTNYQGLAEKGIRFLDCGTSGGMDGARNGACLMIGGEKAVFDEVEPLFKSLAIEDGYLYTGKPGSGHYLKMVHNGIEYGMMQAIGEGFDILHASPDYDFDNQAVAKVWNHGSVIRSWLMELLEEGFETDPNLDGIEGKVHASGEGKWTLEEALRLDVPVPVIATSLFTRNSSQIEDSFSNKVVSTLRHGFGGHEMVKKGEK